MAKTLHYAAIVTTLRQVPASAELASMFRVNLKLPTTFRAYGVSGALPHSPLHGWALGGLGGGCHVVCTTHGSATTPLESGARLGLTTQAGTGSQTFSILHRLDHRQG
jgi:hypothetical protein